MKEKKLIPRHKELSFLFIVSAGVILATLLTMWVFTVLLNQPLSPDFHKALITVRQVKEKIFPALIVSILFQTVLSIVVLSLFALRYSHKISGPMYRVKMIVNDFLEGKDIDRVFFRQDDFLKPLEGKLSFLLERESLRRRLIEDLEFYITSVEEGRGDESAGEKIKELINRLQELDRYEKD